MSTPDPRPRKPFRVFVSHATADKWLATVLCEKIEAVPGAIALRDDRDIDGGDDIPDALRQAISESDELLVLLTPESIRRPWVLIEVGAMCMRGENRIVAIRCHVDDAPIPAMLSRKRVFSINEADRYLAQLRERVSSHLSDAPDP